MAGSTKVVTGKVRLSYVHLTEPYSNQEGQAKKYSCTLLIPKSDKTTIKKIREAQQAALANGKDRTFGGTIPKKWTDTLHDGDEDADLERNPEYEGHYYIAVSSNEKYPPKLWDRALNEIINPTEIYSGCYAKVSMNAFAFANQGNKGVSFGLIQVQKVADGEPLAGFVARAEDDFEALDSEDDDEDSIY